MKILIANWKMNPQTLDEAQGLFNFETAEAKKYENIKTIVCPPVVYLEELAKSGGDNLGAQDIFWEEKGPFTGEISGEMLKNFGIEFTLVGHSDRRYVMGETDEMINKKIKAALKEGIIPVLLAGEREKTENQKQILTDQLLADLNGLGADEIKKVWIAYEPVWAISTNKNAEADTPENTLEAIKTIGEILLTNYSSEPAGYLYGGSVTEKNVAGFLSHPEISGAVIGGASIRKEEFANILKLVASL
jgi:triosephosphate isomerase